MTRGSSWFLKKNRGSKLPVLPVLLAFFSSKITAGKKWVKNADFCGNTWIADTRDSSNIYMILYKLVICSSGVIQYQANSGQLLAF